LHSACRSPLRHGVLADAEMQVAAPYFSASKLPAPRTSSRSGWKGQIGRTADHPGIVPAIALMALPPDSRVARPLASAGYVADRNPNRAGVAGAHPVQMVRQVGILRAVGFAGPTSPPAACGRVGRRRRRSAREPRGAPGTGPLPASRSGASPDGPLRRPGLAMRRGAILLVRCAIAYVTVDDDEGRAS